MGKVNRRSELLSFFVPVAMLVTAGIYKGYATGKASVLESDVIGQYVEYLAYFRSILSTKNNLFYSLQYGVGGSIYGLMAYYLASPLNVIVFFFRIETLPHAIIVIVLVKSALASLTMNIYLRHVHEENGTSWLFASAYGLCGYLIAYYYNIMWLDGIVLLPLIIQGLHQIIKKRTHSLRYILFLAAAIITNYYIAWMICIFALLYFSCQFISEKQGKKEILQKTGIFCVDSVLAGGIGAVILVPVLFVMRSSSKKLGLPAISAEINYDPLEFVAQFFSPTAEMNRATGLPNLFCGSFIFLLFCGTFLKKEKRQNLYKITFLIILMLLGMSEYLNLWCHGLNYNISYPYRYSFIISFFIIDNAYPGWIRISAEKNPDEMHSGIGKKPLLAGAVVLQVAELLFFTCMHIDNGVRSVKEYQAFYGAIRENIQIIRDEGLYRMEKEHNGVRSEAMLAGYNSISSSSSTSSARTGELLEKFGFRKALYGINLEYKEDVSVFADAFWGIKYYCAVGNENKKRYWILHENENGKILQNPYAFPLVFLCGDSIRDVTLSGGDTFEIQNRIAVALPGGDREVYAPVEYQKYEDGAICYYEFEAQKDGTYYLSLSGENGDAENGKIIITVNHGDQRSISFSEYFSVCIGSYRQGETVSIQIEPENMKEIVLNNIYHEDRQAIREISEQIALQGGDIREISSSHFKISVHVTESERNLLFTIPFDKSWRIYVDGVKTEAGWTMDELLMLSLDEGKHEIEMYYIPRGLYLGGCISIVSLAAALGLFIRNKRKLHMMKSDILISPEMQKTVENDEKFSYDVVGRLSTYHNARSGVNER